MREEKWGRKIMGEGRVDRIHCWVGLAAEFRSQKIQWNRLGITFRGLQKSWFQSSERNGMIQKKLVKKNPAPANRIDSVFSSETGFGTKFWEFATVALPETFLLLRALLNLLKESLGRSKPATNLNASTITHCVGFLLYPSLTEPSSIE